MGQDFEFAVSMSFFINEEWGTEIIRNLKGSAACCIEVVWGHIDHKGPKTIWKDGLYDDPSKGVREMAQVLDDIGITCWSMHAPFSAEYDPSSTSARIRQQTEDAFRRCIEHLNYLKGQVLVVHAGFEPISDEERRARIVGAVDMLARLAAECQAAGLQLALENLPRSALGNSAEEMGHLLENINSPAVGVCLDFAHAFVTQGVTEMIERLGSDIITLHICDNADPMVESTCWPMEPGRGLINWPAAICALEHSGYQGPAMYETYSPAGESSARTIKLLEDNYAKLQQIWDSC